MSQVRNFSGDLIKAPLNNHMGRDTQLSYVRRAAAAMSLDANAITQLIEMAESAPGRSVGKSALTNVTVRHPSRKLPKATVLESHTCELPMTLELDIDDSVITYFTQVKCVGVERICNGKRHLSTANVDALVVHQDRLFLVEAKHQADLEKLASSMPEEWICDGGNWRRPPLEAWASKLGIEFRIWSPPWPFGIYIQNLGLIASLAEAPLTDREHWLLRRATRILERGPASIAQLAGEIPTFTPGIAARLMAKKKLFGPVKSVSIAEDALFYLFLMQEQAKIIDDQQLQKLAMDLSPLDIEEYPICGVSTKAFERAKRNQSIVRAYVRGEGETPRRLKSKVKEFIAAETLGKDTLPLFLPNFKACGNRIRRLSEGQLSILRDACKSWQSGAADFAAVRCMVYNKCDAESLPPIGDTTLRAALKQTSDKVRALAIGGKRQFQKINPSSDPANRSLGPHTVGYRLHIDSTKFDAKLAPDLIGRLKFEAPTLYVAVDACHRGPVAHALVFGPARTDALAILLRDYVHRHGRLPIEIFVDRGSENRSGWLADFCDKNGISLAVAPTAGSRYNSAAENLIGRINRELAHRIDGSTKPDQKGRAVDGKFKSAKTARHQFSFIADECSRILYEDLMEHPFPQGGSPTQIRDEAIKAFGMSGTPRFFDDFFLIETSIPIPIAKIDKVRGIRLAEGNYASDALFASVANRKALEMRLDSVNPTCLYIRFESGWVIARSRLAQIFATLPLSHQLAHMLMAPTLRSESKSLGIQRKNESLSKLERSVAQASIASPLATSCAAPAEPAATKEREDDTSEENWNSIPMLGEVE